MIQLGTFLHLDGLYRMHECIKDEMQEKNASGVDAVHFKNWKRIQLLASIHTLLILVETIAVQSIRCIAFTLTGIVTLDYERVKFGLIEGASLIVQIIAIPLLGIALIVSPKKSAIFLAKISQTPQDKKELCDIDLRCNSYSLFISESRILHRIREVISEFIEGLFAIPITLIEGFTRAATSFLSRKNIKGLKNFAIREAFALSLVLPILAILNSVKIKEFNAPQLMLGVFIKPKTINGIL